MSFGLFMWDESGGLQFDATVSTSRILGKINVSSANGSQVVPSQGSPIYAYRSGGTPDYSSARRQVAVSGNLVTWKNLPVPSTIYYGSCKT